MDKWDSAIKLGLVFGFGLRPAVPIDGGTMNEECEAEERWGRSLDREIVDQRVARCRHPD